MEYLNMAKEIDDGLTEEERAALSEDEGEGTEAPQILLDFPEDAGTDAETTAASVVQEAAEPVAEAKPILVSPPPEDAEAKLKDIVDRKEALLAQFDEGDITTREYQGQLDALAKEERSIERAQDRAELAAQMEQQRLQNDWTATCNTFVESHPVYKDNARLYKALDAEVRDLAARSDTASWTGQKFLDEAHKALKASFGFQETGVTKAKSQSTTRDLPPNLAKVPAANLEDTNGGRFAVLDRMANSDPVGYEETLNKMSESERTAYLNA
jgi:FAD/FMN-containing dehydrogenase